MKIIDAFIFYNEIQLLTYRLNLLNDYVDYFILVESTHTYAGKEKILYYYKNKHLFEKFNKKIIHIIVKDLPFIGSPTNKQIWENEYFQRICIARGIDKLSFDDNDFIGIMDLDEIPNPKIYQSIRNNEINHDIIKLKMDMYYYNLNTKMVVNWDTPKIINYKTYKIINCPEKIRHGPGKIIYPGGWHLSYFGDSEFISNKLKNFSHQEFNKEKFTNPDKIKERMEKQIDLFDRKRKKCININIKDNPNLPPYYNIYLTQFIKNL